jgi:DivIVA domain-containing protein
MMDLTPLDVRKKKGDFRRGIRGYEQAQVDDFLELVADRMEVLVRDASSVGERIARLEQQVADYRDREKALTEALVSAQQMREDIRTQSTREVELLRKQAEQDAERIRAEAVRMRDREEQSLEGLRSRQFQFLASYRKYLEQELSDLAAMTQSVEMHAGGARAMPGVRAGGAPPMPPFSPPAAATSAAPAPLAEASPDSAGPVAPAVPEYVASAFGAPATPTVPVPFVAPAPAEAPSTRPGAASPERIADEAPTPASTSIVPEPPSAHLAAVSPDILTSAVASGPSGFRGPAGVTDESDAVDGPEAQLEEALARWEPELGPETAPVPDEEIEELDLPAEVEDDLLLSADDVVANEPPSETVDVEEDVDLSFLEFGEDVVEPAEDPAVAAANAAAVEKEVSDALVGSDDYIDIGTALGNEPDEIDLPLEAIAEGVGQPRDEAEAAVDAAFDFDEAGEDGMFESSVPETLMSGPRPAGSAAPGPTESDDDLAADIDFVDSLLMDAESMFDEERSPGAAEAAAAAESAGEQEEDPFGDAEFEAIATGDEPSDDYGQPENAEEESPDPDLIDLDSFRGIAPYEPPPSTGDVSSLTLHPMFFEEERSELDGEEHEGSRQDHWSSSGGG